jgi:hypothetical protein
VQELSISDGAWVRFIGTRHLQQPQFLDCSQDWIVVSETVRHCVSLFSWLDGRFVSRFGGKGSDLGRFMAPSGVRLRPDGSGFVVADYHNHRLCVFTLTSDRKRPASVVALGSTEQSLHCPCDLLHCLEDDSFLVTNFASHSLARVSITGDVVAVVGAEQTSSTSDSDSDGLSPSKFKSPSTLAVRPGGGFFVREGKPSRFREFRE